MKKFLVLTYGYEEPTPAVMEAWNGWFASVGGRFLDSGSPLAMGLEIARGGARSELTPASGSPLTGYCIVSAESMADAEKLLESLPIIDSVRVYEAMSM